MPGLREVVVFYSPFQQVLIWTSNSELSERSIHLDPEIRNENGVFMKIVLIGANGTIGEQVQKALAGAGHEIVKVGRKSGDFQVDIENRESIGKLYRAVGSFDALPKSTGKPSTGRDHAAIPTIRLSVGAAGE